MSITGLKITPNKFTTVVPFQWLLQNTIGGLVLEQATRDVAEGLSVDERTAAMAEPRAAMQRPFQTMRVQRRSVKGQIVEKPVLKDEPKYKNAKGDLKEYLLKQFAVSPEEAFGSLPAFVVVWPADVLPSRAIEVEVPGVASTWETYDYGHIGRGVIADGESRALSLELINADPSVPAALKDKLLRQPITLEVYHGIKPEQAAQLFVDLNFEGVSVDLVTKANLDPRNKWIQATKAIFNELGIDLATSGRQITAGHRAMNQHLLITHAEQMVKSIALGPNRAIQKSKKNEGPESWAEVDFKKLESAGVKWFGKIFDHFGGPEALGDQARVIRSIPLRVALASLGRSFYEKDLEGMADAGNVLNQVNWVVDDRWNGIAGKVTTNEAGESKMSAAGGKELITKSVAALTKPNSKAFHAVRGLKWVPPTPQKDGEKAA